MVLDLLFSAKEIELHPLEMMLYSLIATIVSSLISIIIFPSYASIIFVFLITIAILPIMRKVLKDQEEWEENHPSLSFKEKYGNIIEIYGFFFLGVILGVWFIIAFYPSDISKILFSEQIDTINAIRGDSLNIEGYAYNKTSTLIEIALNNLKVLFIAFLMSFFFGTGAVFILSWNATIVGVFTSLAAREISSTPTELLINHINALLSISLHGIPEIVAYFLGGIAGAIISYGIINGRNKQIVLKDALITYLIANLIIIAAAFIEVFISSSL